MKQNFNKIYAGLFFKKLCSVHLVSCLAAHIFFKALCLLYASLHTMSATPDLFLAAYVECCFLKVSFTFMYFQQALHSLHCVSCQLSDFSFQFLWSWVHHLVVHTSCLFSWWVWAGLVWSRVCWSLLCGMQHLMVSCRIDLNRVSVVAVPLISCISMFSPFIVFVSFHSALVYSGIWHLFCFSCVHWW